MHVNVRINFHTSVSAADKAYCEMSQILMNPAVSPVTSRLFSWSVLKPITLSLDPSGA